MRITDLTFKSDKAPNILATANTTISVNLRTELTKLTKIDVSLMFDSADTWSKDITFRLKSIENIDSDFAFWDDSALTEFTVFNKLVNHNYDTLEVYILNNDGANNIQVDELRIRQYYE